MKIIEKFETFRNSSKGGYLRKELDEPTLPEEPFKRKLTEEENSTMLRHFGNHSWSKFIDNKGRIILGGGEEGPGKYYITEDDIKSLN